MFSDSCHIAHQTKRTWGIFTTLLIVLVLLISPLAEAVETSLVPEYNVKAAFLVNFVRYTSWPEKSFVSPDAPIIIGVLGANPFGDVLAKTAQLQQGPRGIEFHQISSVEEAAKCQLVFISEREKKNEALWIAALKDKPILIVGESGQTIRRGGLLEFIVVKDRVRFDASLPAMDAAGLKCSAKMLASARTVFRTNEEIH